MDGMLEAHLPKFHCGSTCRIGASTRRRRRAPSRVGRGPVPAVLERVGHVTFHGSFTTTCTCLWTLHAAIIHTSLAPGFFSDRLFTILMHLADLGIAPLSNRPNPVSRACARPARKFPPSPLFSRHPQKTHCHQSTHPYGHPQCFICFIDFLAIGWLFLHIAPCLIRSLDSITCQFRVP